MIGQPISTVNGGKERTKLLQHWLGKKLLDGVCPYHDLPQAVKRASTVGHQETIDVVAMSMSEGDHRDR
ncbi:hypothetical protein CDS [Bradyrhizobium sp.]|nr:hypothetical protein CDS [Bradyrhizobium sp.]